MHAPAVVLLLAHLSVYAYRFLQEKRSAVPQNYDVFLSFRGGETRTGFTDFLYNRLVAAGVHVFRDDDSLPVGKEIGPEILGAIRSSRIAIPIISEQYAESRWCLRELTEIMDCHKKHGKSVFPVFYKVHVVDVSRQGHNFEKTLSKHERECSSEEMLEWQEALTSVARIRGWISHTVADGHEGELANMIVAKVLSESRMMWIERLPTFIRSAYLHFSEKKRRESKYQVFLAFHGPDTQHGFASFLYSSLVAAGIRVYGDDDPDLIGKDFAHEICSAINHCKISIPILSERYASSHWCLKELAQMVKCKRTKGQKILPIFYKVRPSYVRDISHCFGENILRHKELVDQSTYEKWKRALKEVGSSKGWVSEKIANGHEGILVKRVVKEVSWMLKSPPHT